MKQLARTALPHTPPILVSRAGERAQLRFLEFFTANIRNRNTRRAYAQARGEFLAWCEDHRVPSIAAVQPVHVAGYIEELDAARARRRPSSSGSPRSAICSIGLWSARSCRPIPPSSVRGPSHVVKRGKTPVLSPEEARRAARQHRRDARHAGLRDRALIALMVFSFARIGAALAMKVEDVFVQNRRLWVRLREKGGKRARNAVPP